MLQCMKFMLLMYANPVETRNMSASNRQIVAEKHKVLVAQLTDSGELIDGAGLDYPWETITLRWCDGDPAGTIGPFVEAGEQLTAYYLVECADLSRAREIAGQLLDFHVTAVEVRRIHT